MEGSNDVCLKSVRLSRLADIYDHNLIDSRPSDTDMISRDRTDNQSPYFDILWQSHRYMSLDSRA